MDETKSRDEGAGPATSGPGEATARGGTIRLVAIRGGKAAGGGGTAGAEAVSTAAGGATAGLKLVGTAAGTATAAPASSRTSPPAPHLLPRVIAWQRSGVDLEKVRELRRSAASTLYYGRMPVREVLGEIDEDGKPRIVFILEARDPESERYLPKKMNDIRVEARDQQEHETLTERREEELARSMEEPPPPVEPAVGVGVTLRRGGGLAPGTIVRVSPEQGCFWFQHDTLPGGSEGGGISVVNPSAWVCRAVLQPDGVYREDHDMYRVDVGRRESQPGRELGEPGKRPLADAVEAADRLESWLLKTCWAPMTYMSIPLVLEQADELLEELAKLAERARKEAELAEAVRERLAALRAGFKRIR